MQGQIRQTDYLARYGGEEFVLLLPQTGVEGGLALAEKVRGAVEALDIPVIREGAEEPDIALMGPHDRIQVTVSIGLAPYAESTDATFEAADRALYEAKAAGKNRAVVASQESETSEL
jgi:diguanylate cyclase